jgi:hypothetical protein
LTLIGLRRLPAFLAICSVIAAVVTLVFPPSVFLHWLCKIMRAHDDAERHLEELGGFVLDSIGDGKDSNCGVENTNSFDFNEYLWENKTESSNNSSDDGGL